MMNCLKRFLGGLIAGSVIFPVYCQSPIHDHNVFKKADSFLWHFQYDSAKHHLAKAESAFKDSGDYFLHCLTKLKRVEVAFSQELWQEGIAILNEADKIYNEKKLNDQKIGGLMDYYRAKMSLAQRKFEVASEQAEEAIAAFHSTPGTDSILLSKALILQGNIKIKDRWWEQGKSSLEKGLALITRINPDNAEDYLYGKYGLGVYYYGIDKDSAFYHFKAGLAAAKPHINPKNRIIASVHEKMGNLFKWQNEHESAHAFLQSALEIRKLHYPETHAAISTTYNNIGILYLREGDYENAGKFLNKSLAIDRKIFGNYHNFVAISLTNLGNVYKWLGEYDTAIRVLEEALEIRQKLFGEYHNSYASTLNNLSLVYERIPDYEKAIFYQKKVRDIWTKTRPGDNGAQGFIEQNIAMAYYNKGDYDQAMNHSLNSFNYLISNFEATDYSVNPHLDALPMDLGFYKNLDLKALILINMFYRSGEMQYLEYALQTSELLIAFNEKITRTSNSENSKQIYIDEVYQSYQTAILTAYELHKLTNDDIYLEKAFNFLEKSKSFLLLENIRRQQVTGTSGIPAEILQQEDSLKLKIAALKNDIFQEEQKQQDFDTNKLSSLKKDHLETIIAFENLKDTLKKNHDKYFQLKYMKEPISYKDLKGSLLGVDDLVLEYFIGAKYTFIFAIDHTGITVYQGKSGEWLENQVLALRNIIENRKTDVKKFNAIAHALYDSLIAPVDKLEKQEKLIIIPDGILNYLPFEILVKHDRAENFRNLAYLIKDHQIVYQFSANVWHENTSKPSSMEKLNLLAFAPDFNSKQSGSGDDPLLIASRDQVRGNLAPLVGSIKELRSLKDLVNGETLNGQQANERNFKEKAGGFGIIHLATHAVIDDEDPMRSRLLFTYDSLENQEDGNLFSWELYNMQLNARLAVLSACNTGFGKIRRGEGVMSLAHAFAYAGCPAIIMSLWPAQDRVTADIMSQFYLGLADGLRKDQALRDAKLKYLNHSEDFTSHPFYWASFVAQGDPRPISLDKKPDIKWLLIAVISALVTFIAFYAIRKKEKRQVL